MEIEPTSPFVETRLRGRDKFTVWAAGARGHRDGKASHKHPEGQLIVVQDGLLIMATEGTSLMLPPGHIGWIPPNQVHAGSSYGITAGWNAYLHVSLCGQLPDQPAVLKLTKLTEALFSRICEWTGVPKSHQASYVRLLDVLLDELRSAEQEDLALPIPKDSRLAKLAAFIAGNPSDKYSLHELAHQFGFSVRNLSRLFRAETKMSVIEWRAMARMKSSIEQIAGGRSVTDTAMALGFDSVSSFTAQFRRTFAITPSQYRRKLSN
jgi:AraC-like DNA-binding protein